MKSLRRCVVTAGALAFAMAGGSREAKAAGFANTNAGGEQGTVVSTNPMALYYNPGAMGLAKGSQLGLYGSLILRHATYTRTAASSDVPDPPDAQGANTGTAHLTNLFGGPAIAGTLKLGNLVLGAGFFAPFGGSTHWAQNDQFSGSTKYPLAAGGVQRWFAIDTLLRVLYFTAGAAYRLGPLSVGVTGNFISSTIDTTQAKNAANIPQTSMDGRAFLDAHTFNGSFAVGLMLEPVADQLWIGASYQAQPGLGQQSLKGKFNVTTPQNGVLQDTSVDFLQTLPDIYRAGVRWRPHHVPLEFRVFGDRTRWSEMKSQCVVLAGKPCNIAPDGSDNTMGGPVQQFLPRNLNDTYGGRLGISWWVVPEVELLFGGGYETAAVPDATLAPDLMDADNVQGTLGARFRLTESLFLTASYTHIQYMTRDNTGKSTLATDAQGNRVSFPSFEEDAGGIYKAWIGFMTGNLEGIF
jgi:long-chain fatty acid transport protein